MQEQLKQIMDSIGKVEFKKSLPSSLLSKPFGDMSESEKRLVMAEQSLSQDEIAVMVVDEVRKKAEAFGYGFLSNAAGEVFIYNGACWEQISKADIEHFLTDSYIKMGADRNKADTPACAQRLHSQAQYSLYVPIPKTLKGQVMINACNHTVIVDDDSIKTKDHDATDYFFQSLPYPYDPGATYPGWQEFLDTVLPDKDVQKVVQEFFGICLAPSLHVEKALVNIGTGANGKSVMMNIMTHVLGEDNVSHYGINGLCDEKSTTRIMLQHKLLNAATEFSGKIWDNGFFKMLVSGEPVEAKRLYQDPITMTEYARLAFNCNSAPKSRDSSDGFIRRLLMIEFSVKIPPEKQDPDLADKLKSEASGILNWCIEGLQRYLKNGQKFSRSASVKAMAESLSEELDTVRQFISERHYKPSTKQSIILGSLHSDYTRFCDGKGQKAEGKNDFKRRLEDLGYLVKAEGKSANMVWIENEIISTPFTDIKK